jgi:hypothetical protein
LQYFPFPDVYVHSIVLGVHAIITTNPNSLIICGNMLANGGNQLVSSSTGPGGNGKVIHLMANEHSLAINSASVQVLFMGCRPEIENPMHQNNIRAWINIITKLFTIPAVVDIINLKEVWLSRRRRLLVCILGVSEDNDKVQCSRQGIEQLHAWLLNAGSICLNKLMKPGQCSFGTIHTGTTLLSTISLYNILPMDT